MLQYKIPQEVGIADKIVGPFSLRQLIIIAIGVGISYVLFALASKLYELNTLEYIVIALPGIVSLAAAMVKVNNIPLPQFTLLALEFAIKPKKRVWDHRGILGIVAPDLSDNKPSAERTALNGKKERKDVNLEDLTRILDSGGFEHIKEIKYESIDQAEDDDLMIEAFFGHKTGTGENMWARTAKNQDAYKRKLNLLNKLPKPEVEALKKMKEKIELIKKGGLPEEKAVTIPAKPYAPTPQSVPQSKSVSRNETDLSKTKDSETAVTELRAKNQAENKPQTPERKTEFNTSHRVQSEKPNLTQTSKMEQQVKPTPQFEKKKKRRRKKKPKFIQPIRPETQINTTQKNKPVELITKNPLKPIPAKDEKPTKNIEPVKSSAKEEEEEKGQQKTKGGEIHLEELQRGEIELNLD